jgi:hypothetical protein
LALVDFIRVPLPAARMITASGALSFIVVGAVTGDGEMMVEPIPLRNICQRE